MLNCSYLVRFFRQIRKSFQKEIFSEKLWPSRGVVSFCSSRHNKRKPIRFDENGLELGVTTQFHHTNQVWKESFRKTFVKMHRNQEINVLFWFQSWATGPNFVLKYLFTRARVGLKFSVLQFVSIWREDWKKNFCFTKISKIGPKSRSTEILDSWLSYLMMNWRP